MTQSALWCVKTHMWRDSQCICSLSASSRSKLWFWPQHSSPSVPVRGPPPPPPQDSRAVLLLSHITKSQFRISSCSTHASRLKQSYFSVEGRTSNSFKRGPRSKRCRLVCSVKTTICSSGVLLLFFGLALRRESWWQRLQIPQPIRQVPAQQAAEGPQQLVWQVMEVNWSADEHPQPQNREHIQGHVQQTEDRLGQWRQSGCPQQDHRRRFLYDEEGRVGQDEGVSRDVVPTPEQTGPPAGHSARELVGNEQSAVFITGAADVLDVEEGLCADVPHSCGYHQRREPTAKEGHAPAEGRVGQEDEGRQQQQRPPPRHFDKISVEGRSSLMIRN